MRKGIVRVCMLGVVSVTLCGSLLGDIVKFRDGTWVIGEIIAKTNDVIMIQTEEGTRKIYRKDIQEITKGDQQEIGAEPKRSRFRINDIGEIPIPDLKSNVDIWIQKLEPLHRRRASSLVKAQKASRLGKMETVYAWLSEWCEKGFLSVGADDLDGVIATLGQCEGNLRKDIDQLNRRGLCRSCKGSGLKTCLRCEGRQKVTKNRKVNVTTLKGGSYTRTKTITTQCPACKGKGKVPCVYDGSRWSLSHEPEKRAKRIGGPEKMVEIEMGAKRHRSALIGVRNQMRGGDAGSLEELAERCRREKYYYMTLEILKRIERKKNGD